MNITFLIGNGFDINLGLKTRYTDFYPDYMSKNYDNMISNDIKDNYNCWADMELALGQLLKNISKDEVPDYLDQKEQLEKDLSEYLKSQQLALELDALSLQKDLQRNVTEFYKEFSSKDQTDYLEWQKKVTESIRYQFITFNYTDFLDRIVKPAQSNKQFGQHSTSGQGYHDTVGTILHIHGTLQNGLILALDNLDQIPNEDLRSKSKLTQYIIKSKVNERLGTQNTETAQAILGKSDYVCIYGMSLGETDTMWWKYLAKWMKEKDCRRIVLCAYETPTDNPSASENLRQQDKWRDKFLTVAQVDESEWDTLYPRIIVLIRSKIFDFNGVALPNSETEKELISV